MEPEAPLLEREPALAALDAALAAVRAGHGRSVVVAGEAGIGKTRLLQAVQHGARPLQRYRCAACGFEAQHYFWQCPGCQGWDTYPPRRLEAG